MMMKSCPGSACGSKAKYLQDLRSRHKEVVRHEKAHHEEAEDLALSGPKLTDWVEGPDGERYATGGHVMINTSETGDPEEDMRRGKIIVRAAEAPLMVDSELSQADKNVAAKGRDMIAKNQPKLEKLDKLKRAIDGKGSMISRQRLGDVLTGMGLNIPPGKVLNAVA